MKITITENYEASCQQAAKMFVELVKNKPDAKLGLATGGTAERIYELMAKDYEAGEVKFNKAKTVNLDEYRGMPADSPQSYRSYMDHWFFDRTDIDKANTYVASGTAPVEEELAKFNEALYGDGKYIDLQLLGVGVSGHIGFNEPGDFLTAGAHVEALLPSTIEANARFFDSPDDVPREAFTMGMADILKAERIVIVMSGDAKADATKALLMDDKISAKWPVSFLKLHRDVTVLLDKALADKIGYKA